MPDSEPTGDAPIFAPWAALTLGAALLLGLLAIAVFARVDRGRVSELEEFSETTAVGDKVYYHLPDPLPSPPESVALVRGQPLIPISYEKLDARDTTVRPIARDPATRLTIYTSKEPASGEPVYLVKTAANEYLRLRASPAAP